MIKNKIVFAAFSLIASGFILSGCSGKDETKAIKNNDKPIPVVVAKPSGKHGSDIVANGQVEALHSAMISTRMMGYITAVHVKVGDAVKQGQLLFSINSTDIVAKRAQTEAAIAQAEAAFQNAEKDFDRYKTLYKNQSASAKELENMTLQYNAAKAGLQAARQMRNEVEAQMSYSNVRAPFSGVVTQKLMDAGSMASPGMPVLAIEGQGSLRISTSVQEADIAAIRPGMEATIHISSADRVLKGTVTEVSASSQFSGGQYPVKISIPASEQEHLYAGMYAQVHLPVKPTGDTSWSHSLMIPINSIIRKNELAGVYTISHDNTALLRWLRLGRQNGNLVEVLSGLDAQEDFIVEYKGRLYNGAPVTVSSAAGL